jgi:hypothetical protein
MPNTEVKLFSADGSWGISPCESRTSPGYSFHSSSVVELSAVNRSVAGSSLACGAIASIAQQVECFHGKEEVTGSSPVGSFLFFEKHQDWPIGQAVKTPPFHGGNTGSNPVWVTIFIFGGLAQLGEHLPYKQRVGGSIPSSSTIVFSRSEAE